MVMINPFNAKAVINQTLEKSIKNMPDDFRKSVLSNAKNIISKKLKVKLEFNRAI